MHWSVVVCDKQDISLLMVFNGSPLILDLSMNYYNSYHEFRYKLYHKLDTLIEIEHPYDNFICGRKKTKKKRSCLKLVNPNVYCKSRNVFPKNIVIKKILIIILSHIKHIICSVRNKGFRIGCPADNKTK